MRPFCLLKELADAALFPFCHKNSYSCLYICKMCYFLDQWLLKAWLWPSPCGILKCSGVPIFGRNLPLQRGGRTIQRMHFAGKHKSSHHTCGTHRHHQREFRLLDPPDPTPERHNSSKEEGCGHEVPNSAVTGVDGCWKKLGGIPLLMDRLFVCQLPVCGLTAGGNWFSKQPQVPPDYSTVGNNSAQLHCSMW